MSRNRRLFPGWSDSRYIVLCRLREELSKVVADLDRFGISGDHSTLVDFGCGEMPYRPLFLSRVEKYIGVDIQANSRADLHLAADSGEVPLDDGQAGIVLSTQVLEHVDSPAGYLAECRRLLKSNGLLILTTHGFWPYHPSPVDYWRWTGAGLDKEIGEAGFEVLQRLGIMGLTATSVQLLQDALMSRLHRWLRPTFSFLMQRAVSFCDRLENPARRDRDASVFMVVARKEVEI